MHHGITVWTCQQMTPGGARDQHVHQGTAGHTETCAEQRQACRCCTAALAMQLASCLPCCLPSCPACLTLT
jgi:hypothetical protein